MKKGLDIVEGELPALPQKEEIQQWDGQQWDGEQWDGQPWEEEIPLLHRLPTSEGLPSDSEERPIFCVEAACRTRRFSRVRAREDNRAQRIP